MLWSVMCSSKYIEIFEPFSHAKNSWQQIGTTQNLEAFKTFRLSKRVNIIRVAALLSSVCHLLGNVMCLCFPVPPAKAVTVPKRSAIVLAEPKNIFD